jgi:hypothetical protein
MRWARGRAVRSCRSTVRLSRRRWPRASSSAMPAGPSPAPSSRGQVRSAWRTAARSFSTKSRISRCRCRRSSCASCRTVRSGRSAAARRAGWMRGSSPPRTGSSGAWSRAARFDVTCSTASASSPSGSRRCGSAARTCRCSSGTSSLPSTAGREHASSCRRRRSCARCSSIRGPVTSGSSRTRSSRCSSWPVRRAAISPPCSAARRSSTAASGPTSGRGSCAC